MNFGRAVKYTFWTIGAYLALQYATGFGKDLSAAGTTSTGIIRTLQGR